MSIRHHPDEMLLLGSAAGNLHPGVALIVTAHLNLCAMCCETVRLAEAIGGALLAQVPPVSLAADALSRTLARLEAPAVPAPKPVSNDNTPPLGAIMGHDLASVRWRKMGPRLGYATLYRRKGLTVRLLRGAPGSEVGRHSHRGEEYTLVLKGGYHDETGAYGPGDFQSASQDVTHNPIADPGEDCINLAVTTGGLRFDSVAQNLVARIFGF